MTATVAARAHAHAPSARRRRRAVANLAAAAPAPAPAPAPAAAPTAATPAKAADAPKGPVKNPEYDAVDIAGIAGDIAGGLYGGVTNTIVSPYIKTAVGQVFDPAAHPIFGTPYGALVPTKVSGVITAEVGNMVGNIVSDALRGVLHGKVDGVAEGQAGLGWTPTPANKLVAKLVKGVATGSMDIALRSYLAPPPPPPPTMVPAPDAEMVPAPPAPTPPPPKTIMGQPIKPMLLGAFTDAIYKTAISAVYDQTVGPLVQRAANLVTGRADEEVKPPKTLTPGGLTRDFVDSILGTLLVRSIEPKPGKDGSTPFSMTLGASIINNVLGAAWSTVYGRGIGPSVENGVNQLVGVRDKEEIAKAPLPALEHFLRASARGTAVGATTFVLGNALKATMVRVGGQLGGVGGALVAMAGAALIGAAGGTLVDATVGPMLGKLGGQVYTWITGKPNYEERMKAPVPLPGPTPGDPVKSPNGNTGTVPAPTAPAAPKPAAPAAPAAGRPRKRRRTGNPAVDRTAPAINVGAAKLAKIAVSHA